MAQSYEDEILRQRIVICDPLSTLFLSLLIVFGLFNVRPRTAQPVEDRLEGEII